MTWHDDSLDVPALHEQQNIHPIGERIVYTYETVKQYSKEYFERIKRWARRSNY